MDIVTSAALDVINITSTESGHFSWPNVDMTNQISAVTLTIDIAFHVRTYTGRT